MKDVYIEVKVATAVDPGDLIGRLSGCEPWGVWEEHNLIHLFWPADKWNPTVLQDLRHALTSLDAGADRDSISVSSIEDRDWNASWLASLHPVRIGRTLRIRQSWNAPDRSFAGIELVIDPKRAFGSGYHATTQLLIEWLEDCLVGGEQILDVGTGSGILAMAAIRLGARSAIGIDNDPIAIECAKENAQANGFGAELDFRAASLEEVGPLKSDIIVANLDRTTILGFCPLLLSHLREQGRAYLSGLLQEDYEDVCAAISLARGKVVERRAREDWIAVSVTC